MSTRWHRRWWSWVALLAVAASPPAGAQAPPDFGEQPASAPLAPAAAGSIQVPSGGRPLIVTRIEDMPRPLRTAADHSGCKLVESLLAKFAVLIFRPADGRRVMAVVPCQGILVESRAFLFEQSIDNEPTPMTFPVVAPTGGISASNRPGLMTWDAQTATLTAWRGSDVCPAREVRHTYRQGGGELNGFVLSKIEHRQVHCNAPQGEWQTLWQSPAWKLHP